MTVGVVEVVAGVRVVEVVVEGVVVVVEVVVVVVGGGVVVVVVIGGAAAKAANRVVLAALHVAGIWQLLAERAVGFSLLGQPRSGRGPT